MRAHPRGFSSLLLLSLACSSNPSGDPSSASAATTFAAQPGPPGPTPFIAFIQVQAPGLEAGGTVRVTVNPQPGSTARPVSARYTYAALARRGYATSGGSMKVPVYGLYAGATNQVDVKADFADGSSARTSLQLGTPAYAPPGWVYATPAVAQARLPTVPLGFDFYLIKAQGGPPVVMDTDGQVRWVGEAVSNSASARFTAGGIVVGDATSPVLRRLELDGTASVIPLAASGWTDFHHDIADGKSGLLVAVDVTRGGRIQLESVFAEINASGTVLHEWSMGDIIARTMTTGGDDPSLLVRDGLDWFHLNSFYYDPSDDSLLVSSREHFVAKIDYESGDLIWLFGDPTKYWATFPSLASKALTLADGGLWPIGQHAVTLTSDGLLLLFNDGTPSVNLPEGLPEGAALPFNSVCAYSIDQVARAATQIRRYDHEPAFASAFCSSAYQASDGSLLVDYANTSDGRAVLLGLDPRFETAFELSFPTTNCDTAWNAEPIQFGDQSFD